MKTEITVLEGREQKIPSEGEEVNPWESLSGASGSGLGNQIVVS